MLEQKYLGQLNSDDSDRELKDDIRDCLNLVPQIGGRGGSPRRESLKGTLSRFTNLPSGTNITVGQFEDRNNRLVFFFNYNSNNNHGVYMYDGTNTYVVILSSLLNFTERTVISGVGVIDKTLIWTDGENPIRSIDYERAVNSTTATKIKKWEIIVDRSILVGSVPIIRVSSDTSGDSVYNLSTPSSEADIDTKIDYWVTQLSANNELVVVRCGDNIEITESGSSNISSITSEAVVEVAAINHYILPLTEQEITFGNIPPLCEPTFEYKTDVTRKANLVKNKQFQFRTRYVYFDNSKSVLSPISTLAYDRNCLLSDNSGNCIEITFSDAQYTQRELTLVKNVEIFFREGNLGAWYLADSLSRSEFFLGKYSFCNDGVYQVIDDQTANKNYDSIPIKANSLVALKNRVFLGGLTEGYDTPCIEASVDVDIDDLDLATEDNTWTIEGYIRIINNLYDVNDYVNSQPIWVELGKNNDLPVFGGLGISVPDGYKDNVGDDYKQYIPQGGFTVFLAGTQYRATSKQIYQKDGTPNDLTAAPHVYDFSNAGFRNEVRNLIDGGTLDRACYQKYSISGVKPGRYRLRVASHLCYEGNTPNGIDDPSGVYQINGSLIWQQTSTNLLTVSAPISNSVDYQTDFSGSYNSVTAIPDSQEIEIELGLSGGTYNISDATDTVIAISDLSQPKVLIASSVNQIYVRDLQVTDRTSIRTSVAVEKATIEYKLTQPLPAINPYGGFGVVINSAKTDHNGYSYIGVTTYPSIPPLSVNFPWSGLFVLRPQIYSGENKLKDFGENTLLRDYNLSDVFDGSAGLEPAPISDLRSTNTTTEFICLANNNTVREYSRTLIKGVVSSNGSPLAGVTVTANATNRTATTDSTGRYELLVFSDSDVNGNTKTRDVTLFLNTGDNDCIQDSNRFELSRKDAFTISSIGNGVGEYNNDNPYDNVDFVLTGIYNLATASFLKRGGSYQFGILYYDDYLRASLVSTNPRLKKYIPYYTEDLSQSRPDLYSVGTYKYGNPIVNWEIRNQAPSWATKYRWVRTKNVLQETYLTWLVDKVTYVLNYSPLSQNNLIFTREYTNTTLYSNGDANEIHLNLDNIVIYNGNNPNSKIGYTYNDGDRVIITKNNGIYLTDYIDLEIKGYVNSAIVVEAIGTLPELIGEIEIQIYTPKKNTDQQFYYEFSRCYDVVNGYHEGDSGMQTSVIPAVGSFGNGDTYKVGRIINVGSTIYNTDITDPEGASFTPSYGSVYNVIQDHHSISDSIDTKDQSIGRISLVNKDFKQQYLYSSIRFSNPFIQNSFINGIKSLDANDDEALPIERGIIRKLAVASDTILAIHETETTSVRVGEQYLQTPDGAGILTQTDSVIGDDNLLEGRFGTRNPESVVEWNDNVYWYDENKAEPLMYSVNGLQPLGTQHKMRNYFVEQQKLRNEHLSLNQSAYSRVYGGYDPEKKMFVLSFNDMGLFNGDTIGYNDDYNYFSTRFSFRPQHFTKLFNKLYSFKNGVLWEHDADTNNYNNFYGTPYIISYKLVSNEEDSFEKIYRSIGVKTNAKFTVPSITNIEGQETDLIKNDLVRRDDMYYADILRDKNTPIDTLRAGQVAILHGQVMRSQTMTFEFESDEQQYIYVDYIVVEMQMSPGHLLGLKR